MGSTNSRRSVRALPLAVVISLVALSTRLPSATTPASPVFVQTNLVADVAGVAKIIDPGLINPWGLALGTNSGLWVAINGSGTAKSFDGTGQALPAMSPQVVTIPAPGNNTGPSAPTGVVTNAT